jgi:hypothetical protein
MIPSSYTYQGCTNNTAYSVYQPTLATLSTMYNYGFPIVQEVVCYGTTFVLKCPASQLISVYSVYYGIQAATNMNVCPASSAVAVASQPAVCYRAITYTNMVALCQGNNSCRGTVNEASFGDPCIGFGNKQLFVQYQCVDSAALSAINACAAASSATLPSICPAYTAGVSAFNASYWCEPANMNITCTGGNVIQVMISFFKNFIVFKKPSLPHLNEKIS